ncbi:MAG: hypothetical protein ACYDBJ_26190 [Aggregatilineales bacterium]
MSLNELLPEILKLNHDEIVQAIEILKRELAANDNAQIEDRAVYEVWSPAITPETARILQEVLRKAKEKHG